MSTHVINPNLYQNKRFEEEGNQLNQAVLTAIFENGVREESGYYFQHDFQLETSVSVPIGNMEKWFGQLTEEDLENLLYYLETSVHVKQRLTKRLQEIKPAEVVDFKTDVSVFVDKKEIFIQAIAVHV